MTTTSPLQDAATAAQQRAGRVDTSVWVTASAGTGKTKVLTDRVLTLLLAGIAPERILCLTFTRAAAAEMLIRVGDRLRGWAQASTAELTKDLALLTGAAPDGEVRRHARDLFARVIDAPERLRIQNIHSFCQSLLGRFPLEAKLAPHFAVMDERATADAIAAAQSLVLAGWRSDSALAAAVTRLTATTDETRFAETLQALAAERGRLRRMFARHGGIDGAITAVYRRLALATGETEATVLAAAASEEAFDGPRLRQAVGALLAGSKTDRARGATIEAWLAQPGERVARFDDYCGAYLTEKYQPRKRLITKGVATPAVLDALNTEAARLVSVVERRLAAATAEETAATLRLGAAMLRAYDDHKRARALLDFDDLVLEARALLESGPGWVHYKLDGGIDHILVDEAQDTSPDQWHVVAALADEFFAGSGARLTPRTVFAVGDPKQSIYSFQGADPKAFAAMRDAFKRRIQDGKGAWDEVSLECSFRSTKPVLEAVDTVFAGPPALSGVADQPVRHSAAREGHAGLVELWPAVAPAAPADLAPWTLPLARSSAVSAEARLAKLIARRIKSWTAGGERLESKGRPIRAGDVMILVRRRTNFIEHLVRALKTESVPVAGVDRMALTGQLAVMDLMALGEAVLLPEDDLTLACVLKGPLFGFDDDELFALAHARGERSLWAELGARAPESDRFRRAHDELAALRTRADFVAPSAFYAEILGPSRGRFRIVGRLGREANDPIDELLAQAFAYERQYVPSLQGFLHWLRRGDPEIKRDLDQGGHDEVRILTVHRAKGLEAPIVILPDTLQMPDKPPALLWSGADEDELVLRSAAGDRADPVLRGLLDVAKQHRDEEYRRLLYVAMTRAEDRLYICGWHTQKNPHVDCWYGLIERALAGKGEAVSFDFTADLGAEGWEGRGYRLRQDQSVLPETDKGPRYPVAAEGTPVPVWAQPVAAPREAEPPRPLAPSRPREDEPPVWSPIGAQRRDAFRRGRLLHLLLQHLPDVPPERRIEAAQRFLARPVHGLTLAARDQLLAEAIGVIDDPAFQAVIGPGAGAEIALVGTVGQIVISGQVDRLAVRGGQVFVVDYKSQRPAPRKVAETPIAYLRQMGAYRALLAQIYPEHSIACSIVWTAEPRIMQLPGEILDDYAP